MKNNNTISESECRAAAPGRAAILIDSRRKYIILLQFKAAQKHYSLQPAKA